METHNNNSSSSNNNMMISNLQHGYNFPRKISSRNISSDSISSGTFTTSSEQRQTPSTYRSLPNSFTVSWKQAEAILLDDSQKPTSATSIQFIKSTKLRAMKIYGDLKKVKLPDRSSPGTRISSFLYSLFASPKKSKLNQTSKKSRSIKQDSTRTSFSRSSCMSKKQHNNSGLKRSVINDFTLNLDRKSIKERVMPLPKYERRRLTDNCRYMKNYKKFMQVNVEEDDDEDDLFELEIVGGVAYGRELPVFETTDLRKIRM